MKKIAVLGSTGSIGKQTLEVAAANPDKLQIKVLAAHVNDKLLEEQIEKFAPDMAVLTDEKAAQRLKERYTGKAKILAGREGLLEAVTYDGIDIKKIKKEDLRRSLSMVIQDTHLFTGTIADNIRYGKLDATDEEVRNAAIIMAAVKQHNVSLTPVDSEHSAIFQSLQGGRKNEVKRLIITASGGPFLGKTKAELADVTLEQCLKHPNWSMGRKITVDSSTLANKGLEVIEAHWLFDMPYDKIDVVVHPQSIVHSMVEFTDGSVIAQMGLPDMRLPIQYAFSYPERYDNAFGQLDFVKAGTLTFLAPDTEAFPALKIAVECGQQGGTLPCAFNAANEEAVYAFLDGKIKYMDIVKTIEYVVGRHQNILQPVLEDIENADASARCAAKDFLSNL